MKRAALCLILAACAPGAEPPPAAPEAPAMLATLEARGATAALTRAAASAGVETWRTPEDATLSFRGGLLVATRGLGGDLMSADVADVLPLLHAGREGVAFRIHRYLDGADAIVVRSFVCDIAPRGPRPLALDGREIGALLMQERCRGPETAFQNLYWLHAGRILQSRQWIGPEAGSLALRAAVP